MKIAISNLILEITRRCNLHCEHCLRGNAQNYSIDMKYVENIFKRIDRIDCLTFTGGEPQLAVGKIEETLKLAKKYNVEVGSFYIATNGTKNSRKFIMAVIDWYMYCTDNEMTAVHVSKDYFHTVEDNVDFRKLHLHALSFTGVS